MYFNLTILLLGDDGDDDSCRHIKSPANHLEKMLENKSLKGCEVNLDAVYNADDYKYFNSKY